MGYSKPTPKNTRPLDSFSISNSKKSDGSSEFYELELGLVLDIVIDDSHPIFSSPDKINTKLDVVRWPIDLNGKIAEVGDIDYTWIGRALVRPLISEKTTPKDELVWAYPLENNFSEYPLINETVILVTQGEKLFYSKKINSKNLPNNNLNFSINQLISNQENMEMFSTVPYKGRKKSVLKAPTNDILSGNTGYEGYAGKYFVANPHIRAIRRYEGDLVVESRHGQTIHMTAYDSNRNNDIGDPTNPNYKDGGNPMILIRNRQRPLVKENSKLTPHKKLPPIIGTKTEKNAGGYLEEDINHDGTSIHITSGQTISKWVTSCYKKMHGTGEEVSQFQKNSVFKYPILNGDQIVIQSDRVVISSRYAETFHYSKKRYGIVTDNDYMVDAHGQMVFTTNTKAVINSPAIYLGEYDITSEPALLGQTTINWLYEMCNWLLEHTHWHKHSHEDAGKESPSTTQAPVQVQRLIALRDRLHELMSRRVFITGGGLAKGQNGSNIPDGSAPVIINTQNGNGVPGGWNGKNYRVS